MTIVRKLLVVSLLLSFGFGTWYIAWWYRSDPVFLDDQRFSMNWMSEWFFGLLGGLITMVILAGIIAGGIRLVRWIAKKPEVTK